MIIIASCQKGRNHEVCSVHSIIYQAELDELHSYVNLIPSAAGGQILCEDKHRADFGSYAFNSFYNDQIILLSSMSDIEDCSNYDSAAVKIVEWLEGINNNIKAVK